MVIGKVRDSKEENYGFNADSGEDQLGIPARRIAGCRACDLQKRGTQTVFGQGAARAHLMLVGEHPGNEEDLQRHPFVDPAGRRLGLGVGIGGHSAVKPEVLVCLGATAAQALLGRQFRVTGSRQVPGIETGPLCDRTVHPSSILRAPDEEAGQPNMERFVADLKIAANVLKLF